MTKTRHYLPLLGLLIVTSLASGCYRTSEATVNGEAIHQEEFHSALKLAHGHKMLQRLMLQKLISQEAQKRSITLTSEEMKPFLDEIQKNTNDESMAQALEQELRARLFLKKILLSDITEERLRELYQLFAEDLAQREVYIMRCSNQTEARLVETGLKQGQPFHLLASAHGKYKADKHNGGFRGSFTRAQIAQRWGVPISEQLTELKPNILLPMYQEDGDWALFYVGNIRQTFEELRPTLEEMVMSARRPELVYRLLVSAKITSPYITNPKGMPAVTLFEDEPLPWEKSEHPTPSSQASHSEAPNTPAQPTTTPVPVESPEEKLQLE